MTAKVMSRPEPEGAPVHVPPVVGTEAHGLRADRSSNPRRRLWWNRRRAALAPPGGRPPGVRGGAPGGDRPDPAHAGAGAPRREGRAHRAGRPGGLRAAPGPGDL